MTDGKIILQNISGLEAGAAPNTKSNILGAALAIISSIALFSVVIFVFGRAKYIDSVEASLGVATGHPAWKTFQSRVLGPYIIKALSFGSLDRYVAAHIFFHIVTVAIAAFLCWRLGRKYGGNDQSALFALMLFVTCFVSLLSPPWLYSWDLIDIIVFLVFIDFVLSNRSLPWFLGLFAIAMWNRDSADFIALWLILDPLVRFSYQRRYGRSKISLEWQQMLAGAICIGAGLVLAESLRQSLLIEEMAPKIFINNPVTAGNRYNFVLPLNIEFLKDSLFTVAAWITITFLGTVIFLGAKFARLDPQRYLALYFTELALVAALLLFGMISEPRIFLILVPFAVSSAVLVTSLQNTAAGRHEMGRARKR